VPLIRCLVPRSILTFHRCGSLLCSLGHPHSRLSTSDIVSVSYKWRTNGALEHGFYFSIYWEFHHPDWLSYFSEG
jgi:hypothetical protein